jgi:hypothetical protein
VRTGFGNGRRKLKSFCVLAFGGCLALAHVLPIRAQQFSEYEVKAAFLYNFAKFVEWPDEGSTRPLALCVLGDNPFGDALAALEGKRVRGRLLETRRDIYDDDTPGCHVLFINEIDKSRLVRILKRLQRLPVLTVSDGSAFVKNGGIIAFVSVDNRIQFEINLGAAQNARLKISSQLLKLARRVKTAR